MTIEQLNAIIEIADTASFSKAARNLHVSQPNLSYVVKNIEDQIGCSIFERTTDGVFPTEKGIEIIEQLRFLKNDYSMVQEILERKTVKRNRISLNVSTLNLYSVRNTFYNIVNKYSDVPINFTLNDYSTITNVLNHISEVDLSIIGIISSYSHHIQQTLYNQSIEYHPFASLDCYAIVGKKNKYFDKTEPITLDELKSCTLLQYREDQNNPQQSVIHALGLSNESFGKVVVNSTDTFFNIIKETQITGIDFVSKNKFLNYNKLNEIKLIPIKDCNLEWEVAWIKKRQYPLSDIAAEFLDLVKDAF